MESKEALRKLILDDFTPINDLVYRKNIDNEIQIAKPMYLGVSPDDCYNIIIKDLNRLEKYDKALELVKTKRVDITNDIFAQRNYEWYMDYAICHDFISAHLLERDEWNLLKEVFGDGK